MVASAAACNELCLNTYGCVAAHFVNASFTCNLKHTVTAGSGDVDDDQTFYRYCREKGSH